MKSVVALILGASVTLGLAPSLAATSTTVLPSCVGRVVWIVGTTPASMTYVLSSNSRFGKKPGWHACEASAKARGYHMAVLHASAHAPPAHNTKNIASSPMPSASTSPAPTTVVPDENPAITNLARAQIEIFRTGKIDRTQYGANINAVLTDTILTQWSKILAISGAVTSFSYVGSVHVIGLPVSQYVVTFEHAIAVPGQPVTNQWIESIATDQNGKIVYLLFQPKQ